jgi:hypothetical protein
VYKKDTFLGLPIVDLSTGIGYSLPMAIEGIIAQLDAEIARLTHVRNLLSATGKVEAKITAVKGKPTRKARGTTKAPKAKTGVKRVLSPEARKAIADAQRKRWAAQKAKKS